MWSGFAFTSLWQNSFVTLTNAGQAPERLQHERAGTYLACILEKVAKSLEDGFADATYEPK